MKFGLISADIQVMKNIFKKYPDISKVIIFGSRAMGNYKKGSDVDLAIKGKNIDLSLIGEIKGKLDETNLPYFFDVISYADTENKELREHIDTFGQILWDK